MLFVRSDNIQSFENFLIKRDSAPFDEAESDGILGRKQRKKGNRMTNTNFLNDMHPEARGRNNAQIVAGRNVNWSKLFYELLPRDEFTGRSYVKAILL